MRSSSLVVVLSMSWGLLLLPAGQLMAQDPPVVLHDQSALQPEDSVAAQDFEEAYDLYDCEAADDFVVSWSEGWSVEEIKVLGFYTAGSGQPVSANVWIYADDAGLIGSPVCTELDSVIVSDVGGWLEVELGSPCYLPQASYWLAFQLNMDILVGGQWMWYTAPDVVGSEGQWRNPTGGWGTGCTDWSPISGCFTTPGITPLFQLIGHEFHSGLIFSDGFESGDTTAWTSTSGG
jgi:hypothetical protein